MSWLKRGELAARDHHVCPLPAGAPWAPPDPTRSALPYPSGRWGDVWRCDEGEASCGTLWRIGYACVACERVGRHRHAAGCAPGLAWWRVPRGPASWARAW